MVKTVHWERRGFDLWMNLQCVHSLRKWTQAKWNCIVLGWRQKSERSWGWRSSRTRFEVCRRLNVCPGRKLKNLQQGSFARLMLMWGQSHLEAQLSSPIFNFDLSTAFFFTSSLPPSTLVHPPPPSAKNGWNKNCGCMENVIQATQHWVCWADHGVWWMWSRAISDVQL